MLKGVELKLVRLNEISDSIPKPLDMLISPPVNRIFCLMLSPIDVLLE